MKRLLFGCGYLGARVARQWLLQGDKVYGVTRRRGGLAELVRLGLHEIVADVTEPATLTGLPPADSVLYAVGYDRRQSQSMEEVYAGGVGNVLAALPDEPRCFTYVSTTGVYPDNVADWVDEQTPVGPSREGGRASLAAEGVLFASRLASRGVVLRLAGLYGPGRVPFLEELRTGKPVPSAEGGWLNLIHVGDAAAAVVAADRWMHRRGPGSPRVFNVADGHPVHRPDFYAEVARVIGAPGPRFEPPDPSSHRAARAASNRRISNAAMIRGLEMELAHPTFREGLRAILST